MAQQITLLGVGDTLVNRYKLIQELGRGSYGVVWRAQQLDSGQNVAIKTLLPQAFLDPEIPERFDREIQLVSRLKHPNIVALHDHGQHNGLLYMAIEFIEGRSLGELIRKDAPLPAAQVISLMRQILGALGHAHAAGIVHRDLKPENILLQRPDPAAGRMGETVKVLDFGIAKLIRSARDGAEFKTLTQSGHVLGTPHYMSPEQIVGDHIDHRTDLYAIGIILYELLTGTHPFDAPNSTAVMVRHLRDDPAPLPEPLRSSRWAKIISGVLTKQADDRFPTAQAFLAAIEQAEPFATAAPRASKLPEGRSGGTSPASRPLAAGVEIADPDMSRELDEEATRRLDMDERAPDEQTKRLDMEAIQTSLWTTPDALTQLVEPLELDHHTMPRHSAAESADSLHITPPPRPVQHTSPLPVAIPQRHAQRPSPMRWAPPVLALILIFGAAATYLSQRQTEADKPPTPPITPIQVGAPTPTRPATLQALQDSAAQDSSPDSPSVESKSDLPKAPPTEDKPTDKPSEKIARPDRVKPDRTRPPKVTNKSDKANLLALRITSEPSDARVVIDGKPVGNTPLTYKAPPGQGPISIRLSLIGYRDHQALIQLGDQSNLHVRLEKGQLQLIP
jgi:serine/threonine protein kinase